MILRSGIPIYEQVKSDILNKIKNNVYLPGRRLPSERELSDIYNVSRVTIRQAISSLVTDGVLEKYPGSGTYVTQTPERQPEAYMCGIVQELEQQNIRVTINVLDFIRMPYSPKKDDIWGNLSVPPNEPVYEITRVLSTHNKPLLLDYNYFPPEIGIKYQSFDISRNVIFNALDTLGYHIHHAKQKIQAKGATSFQSKHLQIPVNSPLLEICRISFDKNDTPLLYTKASFVGERYSYNIDLGRDEHKN